MRSNERWWVWCVAGIGALGAAACTDEGQIVGSQARVRAEWSLQTDDSLALLDPRCTGTSCPAYPNPSECDGMQIRVLDNGRVCGVCRRGWSEVSSCGGIASGIPYECGVSFGAASSATCLRCRDLFGTVVLEDCGGGVARAGYALRPTGGEPAAWSEPPGPEGGGESCFDARRADGTPCQICVDASRTVSEETCTTTGDPPPAAGETPPVDEPPAAGSSCPDTGGVDVGREVFAGALNPILRAAGLDSYAVGDGDPDGRLGFALDPGEIPTGEGICAVREMFVEEIADDIEGRGDGWWREGRPRCAFMAMHAIVAACSAPNAHCAAVERGMTTEYAAASRWMSGRYDCIGSPIVLDLDGDGVRSVRGEARFDLGATGEARPLAWIARGDALLARDRDGDGAIENGLELFGELTPIGRGIADHGFEALGTLDSDRDGDVDASDREWSTLVAWRDDGDGRSEPGELIPLEQAGVARLFVAAREVGATDDAGSVLGLWGRFERTAGGYGISCDVFFSIN